MDNPYLPWVVLTAETIVPFETDPKFCWVFLCKVYVMVDDGIVYVAGALVVGGCAWLRVEPASHSVTV